jgi:hypothetical protein
LVSLAAPGGFMAGPCHSIQHWNAYLYAGSRSNETTSTTAVSRDSHRSSLLRGAYSSLGSCCAYWIAGCSYCESLFFGQDAPAKRLESDRYSRRLRGSRDRTHHQSAQDASLSQALSGRSLLLYLRCPVPGKWSPCCYSYTHPCLPIKFNSDMDMDLVEARSIDNKNLS